MVQRGLILAGIAWTVLHMSGLAYAQSAPDRVVEQYISALSQGRFAEARTLTLESANMDGSIFGHWLFGARGAGLPTATAELFLSQKFVEAFRYTITGTTPVGENQVYVTAVRSSPDVAHLYEWAVLPKKGAEPYEIITAIDTYLTAVNFPMEESRLRFTLIREVDVWLISAISDARFARLRRMPVRAAGGARAGWSGRRCGFAAGRCRAGVPAAGTHRHDHLDGCRAAACPTPNFTPPCRDSTIPSAPLIRISGRGRPVGVRQGAGSGNDLAQRLRLKKTDRPGGGRGPGKVLAEYPRGDQPLHGRQQRARRMRPSSVTGKACAS